MGVKTQLSEGKSKRCVDAAPCCDNSLTPQKTQRITTDQTHITHEAYFRFCALYDLLTLSILRRCCYVHGVLTQHSLRCGNQKIVLGSAQNPENQSENCEKRKTLLRALPSVLQHSKLG